MFVLMYVHVDLYMYISEYACVCDSQQDTHVDLYMHVQCAGPVY